MRERKRNIAYNTLVLLGVAALLCYVTRLWPILLLALVAAIIAAVCLMFQAMRQREEQADTQKQAPCPPPQREETERELLTMAYRVLQRRISDELRVLYPDVRWIWEIPNPMAYLSNNTPIPILLNRAGGYKRAVVTVQALRFSKLEIQETPTLADKGQEQGQDTAAEPDPVTTDYALMAYTWVDGHLLELSSRCNEAIASGSHTILITGDQLPERECWESISELLTQEFASVSISDDGISVTSKS